jgi:hypothetical protein
LSFRHPVFEDRETPEDARMQRVVWLSVWAVFSLVASGCGDSQQPTNAAAPSSAAEATGQSQDGSAQARDLAANGQPKPLTGPAAAAATFLEAARRGDDQTAGQMLTNLARQKLREHGDGNGLATIRSDTADFIIDEVKMLADDGAQVKVTIKDLREGGKTVAYEVAVILRKQPEGWRVAGVATPVFDGQWLLVRNFEDPDDWQRQIERYEEEARRRAAEHALQAQQPAASSARQ